MAVGISEGVQSFDPLIISTLEDLYNQENLGTSSTQESPLTRLGSAAESIVYSVRESVIEAVKEGTNNKIEPTTHASGTPDPVVLDLHEIGAVSSAALRANSGIEFDPKLQEAVINSAVSTYAKTSRTPRDNLEIPTESTSTSSESERQVSVVDSSNDFLRAIGATLPTQEHLNNIDRLNELYYSNDLESRSTRPIEQINCSSNATQVADRNIRLASKDPVLIDEGNRYLSISQLDLNPQNNQQTVPFSELSNTSLDNKPSNPLEFTFSWPQARQNLPVDFMPIEDYITGLTEAQKAAAYSNFEARNN